MKDSVWSDRSARGSTRRLAYLVMVWGLTAAPAQAAGLGDAFKEKLNQATESVRQTVDRVKEDAGRISEGVRQNVEQTTRQIQTQGQQMADQFRQQWPQLPEGQREALGRSLDRIGSQFGPNQARQLADSIQRVGPKQAELLTQVYEKYGQQQQVAQRMLTNVLNQPEAVREKILSAYQSHSANVGDRVADCYARYFSRAPDFAERLGVLYTQNAEELAGRLNQVASSQGLANARSILAYYAQNANVALATRLCDLQGRYNDRWKSDLRNITDRVVGQIKDPQNQTRAIECAIKALEVYNDREAFTTNAIKTVLQEVRVTTSEGETINAEEFLKREVVRQWPQLAGTTIAEDPVRCLTYGVIYKDHDFLFNDLKVIPSARGALSASEALGYAIGTNPAETMAVLDHVEAWSVVVGPESQPEETAQAVAYLLGTSAPMASGIAL